MSLSDAIKAEIERQGLTAYRVAKMAGIKPDVVSRFLSGERDIVLATADTIAAVWGLVLTRAGEPPADRPGVSRTAAAAISVWTVGDGESRKAVAIRPARESDGTDFEWVLCVHGEPVDFGDDRDALEAEVPGWLDTLAD
jgi:transcriptional regulator with XRE-family HTH domain